MGGWAYLLWFLYKLQRIAYLIGPSVPLILQTMSETEGRQLVRPGIELTATV
jgi:hypothetical protein